MKVKEILTTNPKVCTTTTNLAEAASFMWDYDCGILPVVGDEGRVVGLITDRDICIAGATKNRNLSDIAVEETMTGKVYSCAPEDDVDKALDTMQQRKVRRLPEQQYRTDSDSLSRQQCRYRESVRYCC